MAPLAIRPEGSSRDDIRALAQPAHPDARSLLLREAAMPWRSLIHNSRFVACLWAEMTALWVWAVGQLSGSALAGWVAVIAGCMATLAGGFVAAAQVVDGWRAKKRRADLDWHIERQRKLDEERRAQEAKDQQSLTARLATLQADIEKLRKTNHDINNQLNVIKLENHELHDDLRETTRQLHDTSEKLLAAETKLHEAMQQLYAANVRIGELTNELHKVQRQTPGIVEDAAERGAAKGAGQVVERAAVKVAEKAAEVAEKAAEQAAGVEAAAARGAEKGMLKALSDSNVDFPIVLPPEPRPGPDSGLGGQGATP